VFVTFIYLLPAVVVTIENLSPARIHTPEHAWTGLRPVAGQPPDASEGNLA
jgi:hypothetical protein